MGKSDVADFDFDDIVKLRFDSQILPRLQEKISPWRSQFETPDLTVEKGLVYRKGFQVAADMFVSVSGYQMTDPEGEICSIDDERIVYSEFFRTDFLNTYIIKPVINRLITPKGCFLLRASAIALGNRIIVFPSRGKVGKTSILLEFLRRGASYMANGDIFVDRKGKCTLYSKWLNLQEYHMRLFPDLAESLFHTNRERRREEKRISFYRLGASMGGKNFISRFVKANLVSRFSFNYSIPFDRLFPQSGVKESGIITHVFLLERNQSETSVVESKPEDVARLAAAMQWIETQGRHNFLADLAGLKTGTMSDITGILGDFFNRASCHIVQIRKDQGGNWIAEVADVIERNLN